MDEVKIIKMAVVRHQAWKRKAGRKEEEERSHSEPEETWWWKGGIYTIHGQLQANPQLLGDRDTYIAHRPSSLLGTKAMKEPGFGMNLGSKQL